MKHPLKHVRLHLVLMYIYKHTKKKEKENHIVYATHAHAHAHTTDHLKKRKMSNTRHTILFGFSLD